MCVGHLYLLHSQSPFSPEDTYLHAPFLFSRRLSPSCSYVAFSLFLSYVSPLLLSPSLPLPSPPQLVIVLLNSPYPSPTHYSPSLPPPLPSSTHPLLPPSPPFPPIQSPEKRRRLSSESPLSGSIRHVSGGLYLTSILPEELLLHIFSFLSESDLCQASLVCKKFARFASDRKLWRDLFLRTFGVSRAYVHPKRNPELVKVDVTTLSWKEQFSVMVSFTYSTCLH